MKIVRNIIFFSLALLLLSALIISTLYSPQEHGINKEIATVRAENLGGQTNKKVLVLFPYQTDLPHTVLATRALRDTFAQSQQFAVELYVEYLDLNRFAEKDCEEQFLRLLQVKYGQHPVDLVLLTGEGSLSFWLTHRQEVLPRVPAVFYDMMSERLTAYQPLPAKITGITSQIDHLSAVNWLLRVRPKLRELIIVRGAGVADQEDMQAVKAVKEHLQGRVKVTDWHDRPLAVIKQQAATLPPSTAILYHLMFEDAAGKKFRPLDALQELAQVSAVPVLSSYDQFIGRGTIGGCMYSIAQQARLAARLGLRILGGTAASSLPVTIGGENQFIFDHPALLRYGIPLSALPPGSIVENRQYSLWELHREKIIAVVMAFLALFLVIAILIGLIRQLIATRLALSRLNAGLEVQVAERTEVLSQTNCRLEEEIKERMEAEQALLASETRYRLLADNAPLAVGVTDLETGQVLYANDRAAQLFSPAKEALAKSLAKDWYANPEERDQFLHQLAEQGYLNDFEIKMKRASGEEFWISMTSHISVFEKRPAIHSVFLEITDRKQAEAEREQLIADLQEALSKVKQLEGILPICSFCKKIKDENGDWHVLEQYIGSRSKAQFSHGFCKECAKKHYPEYFQDD